MVNYQDALKEADRSSLLGQEETFKSKYGVKTFSDEQFTKLVNSETAALDKIIQGISTYRMLDSLEYQQALQYEPARKRADGTCCRDNAVFITTNLEEEEGKVRENETDQMDATYLAINLAFLPKEKMLKFNMDTSGENNLFNYQKKGIFGYFT